MKSKEGLKTTVLWLLKILQGRQEGKSTSHVAYVDPSKTYQSLASLISQRFATVQ